MLPGILAPLFSLLRQSFTKSCEDSTTISFDVHVLCVSHYFNGVFAFPPHSYVFTLQAASEVKFLEQKSDHISSLLEVLHRRSYLLPQTPKYLVFQCSFVTVPTYTDLSCSFLLSFPAPVGTRKSIWKAESLQGMYKIYYIFISFNLCSTLRGKYNHYLHFKRKKHRGFEKLPSCPCCQKE